MGNKKRSEDHIASRLLGTKKWRKETLTLVVDEYTGPRLPRMVDGPEVDGVKTKVMRAEDAELDTVDVGVRQPKPTEFAKVVDGVGLTGEKAQKVGATLAQEIELCVRITIAFALQEDGTPAFEATDHDLLQDRRALCEAVSETVKRLMVVDNDSLGKGSGGTESAG
jgi:hypothetical protein